LGFVNGRAERDANDKAKSKIHSSISFETSDERYFSNPAHFKI